MNTDRAPRVGVGCIVVRDGALLLLLRRGAHGEGTWSTPGGHLDYGERPDDCAARETLEETSITVNRVSFLAITNDIFPEVERHYVTLWMRGQYVSGEATIAAPHEVADIGWFPIGALPTPRFLTLDNLLANRCWPPEPPSMPLARS